MYTSITELNGVLTSIVSGGRFYDPNKAVLCKLLCDPFEIYNPFHIKEVARLLFCSTQCSNTIIYN